MNKIEMSHIRNIEECERSYLLNLLHSLLVISALKWKCANIIQKSVLFYSFNCWNFQVWKAIDFTEIGVRVIMVPIAGEESHKVLTTLSETLYIRVYRFKSCPGKTWHTSTQYYCTSSQRIKSTNNTPARGG
jgi:hypothetical protein